MTTAATGAQFGNAAYDPVRNQVVEFGGITGTGGVLNQTWVWSPGTSAWVYRSPAASPSPRAGAAMAWDPAIGKVVLFGGLNASFVALNDLWAWDGSNWAQLTPAGGPPAARYDASMTWDPAISALVLFGGGSSSSTFYNDTWKFASNSWTVIQSNGASGAPAQRESAAIAYSTSTSQMLLFGGTTAAGSTLGDTWILGASSWAQQSPSASPPARYAGGAVYDAGLGQGTGQGLSHGAVVLFGGISQPSGTLRSDTWAWTGTTWQSANSAISTPSGRYGFSMAATDAGQVVMFGGTTGGASLSDTWLYDTNVPVMGVSTSDANSTSRTPMTGDSLTVTITAENVGNAAINATTITSPLGHALLASGSAVTWAGTQLTACATTSSTLCGAVVGLSATISNVTLNPAAVVVGSYVATLVGSSAGCTLLSIPVTAANLSGTSATATTSLSSCGGGLGNEDWWSYDTTDLGAAGVAKVNVANGNLVVQQTDSTPITSHGQLGFDLGRVYNSQDDAATPGDLGLDWRPQLGRMGIAGPGGLSVGGLVVPLLQSAAQPLSVTYVDRDGTRQVFTLHSISTQVNSGLLHLPIDLNDLFNSSTSPLFKLLDPTTLPFTLSGTVQGIGYNTLCLDATYTAPPGVDESMYRFIGITTTDGRHSCDGAASTSGAVTVGWSVVRPDRVRYDFNPEGSLLDVADGAGNKLIYAFDPTYLVDGQQRAVQVYSASCIPSTTISSSPVSGPSCPSISVKYTDVQIGAITYTRIDVTDAAGRVTTYLVSHDATAPELMQVWNPDDPFSTAAGATASIRYTYSTATTPCPGSAAGVTTVGSLCSVTDPDGNLTRFAYTPSPTGPDRVLSITDARATASGGTQGAMKLFTYHDAQQYVTVDTAAPSVFGSAVPATGCVGSAVCERTRYVGIDDRGRVSEIDDGNAADQYLHQQGFFWDGTTAFPSCDQPGAVIDNDLCETITRAVPSSAPFSKDGVGTSTVNGVTVDDHAVRYQYGDMGQLLGKTVLVDPSAGWSDAGTDVTTYGSHEQYFNTDGSVKVYDDTVRGSGTVSSTSPAASGAYASSILGDSPTSYYRFNETSGSTLIDATGAHNGTYAAGVPLAQTGRLDNAIDEMGGQWAATAPISNFAAGTGASSAFSIESWVNTTDTGIEYQAGLPLSGGAFMVVGRAAGGLPALYITSDLGNANYLAVTGQHSIADGDWHQIDITYDGSGHASGVTIYVDGQPVVAQTVLRDALNGPFAPTSGTLGIGAVSDATGPATNSQLDELALFSSVLTPGKVAAHYTAATGNTRLDAYTLYAIDDQTQMLPPRGNTTAASSHWGDYLTTYRRDTPPATTSQSAYPRPNQTAASTVCGAAAGGNTGLLCESDTPSSAGVPAGACQSPLTGAAGNPPTNAGYTHACTTYGYDKFGQRTSRTSPDANALNSTTSTAYRYLADTGSCAADPNDCDLTGTVSMGGHLLAVTDPLGKSVVHAYDAAGNPARTWSRNATQNHNPADAWSNAASPPSGQYAETDHANPVTSALLSVSAGDTEIVTPAGAVQGSGANAAGQLGTGTTAATVSPVSAVGPIHVVQIVQTSGGTCQYTLARTSTGALIQWGNGTSTPTTLTSLPPVIDIAAGGCHLLALDNTGRVWAWGSNASGQLGDGTTTNRTAPVQVLTGVAAVAAGGNHSLAIKTDGTVWAWGSNASGQLGDGSTSNHSSPTQISSLSRALAVAGGSDTSYAILADGTVWAWGSNASGALGTGSASGQATTPQLITALDPRDPVNHPVPRVRQIAAGYRGAAALLANGTVQAWGDNGTGQLGGATGAASSSTPLTIPGLTGQVALAGNDHAHLSATAAGAITIWGQVSQGQVGDGSNPTVPVPPEPANYTVSPFAAPWRYVQAVRDPAGNLSQSTADPIGQVLITRPARGTAVLTSAYDSTATYDADGNQLTTLAPLERTGVHQSSTTYDSFGNGTVSLDANGTATVTDYDSANRAIDVKTTRGTTSNSTGSGCTATAPAGGPWPAAQVGHTICETSATYDGNDLTITSSDALSNTTYTGYDAAGQKISQQAPRNDLTYTTLTTRWVYDPDGNLTDTCPPRQFDTAHEQDTGTGCTSTGAYSTHTSYDNADRPSTVTVYRVTGTSSATAETTTTSRDADGNPISVTDANGHTTTTRYDLLDRKISQTVPRSATLGETTTWQYDPSGNITAVLAPGTRYVGTGQDGSLVIDGSTSGNSTDHVAHGQSNPFQIPDGAQYTNVTLQNGGWVTSVDPHGLFFYATGTITVCTSCGITEAGKGYAGGAGPTVGGTAGGNAANPVSGSTGNGGLGAGAGGLSTGNGAGGGGGGHKNAGAAGSRDPSSTTAPGAGGAASGTSDFSDVATNYLLGAGGGGGGGSTGFTLSAAGNGGNGGGFVHLIANAIVLNGGIDASGANGVAASGGSGGGGGGAGGGIWLDAANFTPNDPTPQMNVAGGTGGAGTNGANGGNGAPGVKYYTTGLTGQAQSANVTAYSYDPDNRVIDTVKGAQNLDASDLSDQTGAKPDDAGLMNQRTRTVYDPDGHVLASLPPQAFTRTGSLTNPPNTDTAARADYDLDGRAITAYDPRYNGTATDISAGSGGDGGTGADQQTSECPTGADPDFAAGLPNYTSTVGVCMTRTVYDPAGRVSKTYQPAPASDTSRYLAYTYTDDNLTATVTAPAPNGSGRVTAHTYLYDGDDRPIVDTDANGNSTTSSYTADGLITETDGQAYTSAGGGATVTHKTINTYDAAGNQITSQAPNAQNPISPSLASDYVTTTTWTSDGLQASIRRPGIVKQGVTSFDTTSYTYDPVGNPTSVASPSANAGDANNPDPSNKLLTTNTFTDDNLLATSSVPITSGKWRTTVYTYAPMGLKTAVSIGTCTVSDPSSCRPGNNPWNAGGTTRYTYAPDGLNLTQIGRNPTNGQPGTRTITTSYDHAGRPISIYDNSCTPAPCVGITVSAGYYLDGLLRTADDGTNTNTYAYNGAGQLTVRTDHTGSSGVTAGATDTTSYAYGDAQLPTQTTSDVTGTTATWIYDSGGRPTGRVDKDSSGNTLRTTSQAYNADDSLTSLTTKNGSGTTLALTAYTYDDNGNILSQAVTGSAQAFTNTYAYNPAGNLIHFIQSSGGSTTTDIGYVFDHDANRLNSTTNTGSAPNVTWTYNADDSINTSKTGSAPTMTFAYSNAGEVKDDGCLSYTYDEFQRTATAVPDSSPPVSCGPATGTTTYTYDGLDRQQQAAVTGTSHNTTTVSSFDGPSSTIVGQTGARTGTTATDGMTTTTLYQLNPDGAQVAFAQTRNGTTSKTFLNTDGNGNITSLLNSGASATTCSISYDPYGTPILGNSPPANGNGVCAGPPGTTAQDAPTTGNVIWYRGQARGASTSEYQLGTRTYSPTNGGFTTPDAYRVSNSSTDLSVGTDPYTANTYTYVNGNPVNFSDPNGHDPAGPCSQWDDRRCYPGDPYYHDPHAGYPGHPCQMVGRHLVSAWGLTCNALEPFVANPPTLGEFCHEKLNRCSDEGNQLYCALYNGPNAACANGHMADPGVVIDQSDLITIPIICTTGPWSCGAAVAADSFGHCDGSTADCAINALAAGLATVAAGKVLEFVGGKIFARGGGRSAGGGGDFNDVVPPLRPGTAEGDDLPPAVRPHPNARSKAGSAGAPRGGASGDWPTIGQRVTSDIPVQAGETACGAACGVKLIGGSSVQQADIGLGAMTPDALAARMNAVAGGSWNGGFVDATQANLQALSARGPWSALLNPEAELGHYVVVDGISAGRVSILDPRGLAYELTHSDFLSLWADRGGYGGAVFP